MKGIIICNEYQGRDAIVFVFFFFFSLIGVAQREKTGASCVATATEQEVDEQNKPSISLISA